MIIRMMITIFGMIMGDLILTMMILMIKIMMMVVIIF